MQYDDQKFSSMPLWFQEEYGEWYHDIIKKFPRRQYRGRDIVYKSPASYVPLTFYGTWMDLYRLESTDFVNASLRPELFEEAWYFYPDWFVTHQFTDRAAHELQIDEDFQISDLSRLRDLIARWKEAVRFIKSTFFVLPDPAPISDLIYRIKDMDKFLKEQGT